MVAQIWRAARLDSCGQNSLTTESIDEIHQEVDGNRRLDDQFGKSPVTTHASARDSLYRHTLLPDYFGITRIGQSSDISIESILRKKKAFLSISNMMLYRYGVKAKLHGLIENIADRVIFLFCFASTLSRRHSNDNILSSAYSKARALLFLASSYHLSSPLYCTHIRTLKLIYRLRLAGAT